MKMSEYLVYGVKSYFEDSTSFEDYKDLEDLARNLADITLDQLEDEDGEEDITSANNYADAIKDYTEYVKNYILKEYGNPFEKTETKAETEVKTETETETEVKAKVKVETKVKVEASDYDGGPLYDMFFKKQVIQFKQGDTLEMRCQDGSVYYYNVVDRTSRTLRVKGKSSRLKTLRISKVQLYGATYTEEVSTYNASCRASTIRREEIERLNKLI